MARRTNRRKNSSAATQAAERDPQYADLPAQAIAPNGLPYARARMKHPTEELYYRQGDPPWVKIGYDTYSIEDWRAKFAKDFPDGRNWDFFGDPIKIWGSYSDE